MGRKKPGNTSGLVEKAKAEFVENGLGEAIGFHPGTHMQTEPLSSSDTLFKNNRGYLISNFRQMLSQSYCEIGLIETIVDLPVEDGLRGGIEITTDQLDGDEIEDLLAEMEAENDLETYAQAEKWKRLFGGAGVIIMTGQDASTPFSQDSLKEGDLLEFKAVDMWELYDGQQMQDERFTEAVAKEKRLTPEAEYFMYYGKRIHKSRVIRLRGKTAPSFIRPTLRGWGMSVVETLVRSVNQYLKTANLTFDVLDEFKIDHYKVKNLAQTLLSKDGTALVQKRLQMINFQKNYQNSVAMDADDDWIQKQLNFGGLAETMAGIRMQVASDMRMPLTKLFGISAGGFSSGEDDIENYNAMIESTIRSKGKHNIVKMVKLRCLVKYGMVPDDLKVSFKPLRILSSEQEENVKTQKFSRIIQAKQGGLISGKEFADACNRDNLLGIQIDAADGELRDAGMDGEGGDNVVPIKSASAAASAPPKEPVTKNSLEYSKAKFEADGGDKLFTHKPIGKPSDRKLWAEVESDTQKVFGKDHWQFSYWLFKERGGKIK